MKPETLDAWAAYILATEQRIEREHVSDAGFLVQDFADDADRGRAAVRRGEAPVRRMETGQDDGSKIKVRKGAIHHWRGSIFIPGVTLEDVIDGVKNPLRQEDLQEDVLESLVLEQGDDRMKVFLKLRRKKFITVHYNAEHEMRYTRHDGARASSRSIATKIAELRNAGTPFEEEKPAGNDRGFLWRLNSYWRYAEVDGDVIVECESVSLSRSILAAVRWMVMPPHPERGARVNGANADLDAGATASRCRHRPCSGHPVGDHDAQEGHVPIGPKGQATRHSAGAANSGTAGGADARDLRRERPAGTQALPAERAVDGACLR